MIGQRRWRSCANEDVISKCGRKGWLQLARYGGFGDQESAVRRDVEGWSVRVLAGAIRGDREVGSLEKVWIQCPRGQAAQKFPSFRGCCETGEARSVQMGPTGPAA